MESNKGEKSRQPTIRQLEYFVNIAMSSNFRKAAEKLNISQPTLTAQMNSLESTLGTQLFERSRAGTLLSPSGRELLPQARRLLEHYQQLLDETTSTNRELNGIFKMGVSPTIGPYLLPHVLPELHNRYPRLKLHVREGVPQNIEAGLEKGDFDFILTMLPMQSSEHRVRPLFTEPLHVIMSADHPLAQGKSLNPDQLQQQHILTIDENHHLHRQVANLCEHFGANMQSGISASSLNSLYQMVVMGMGLAFMPGMFLQSAEFSGEGIRVMPLGDENIIRTHVAAWRKNSPARHLLQKITYDIKTIAIEHFPDVLEEAKADDHPQDFI